MELAEYVERTLVLIKPDAIARGLTGDILCRFERLGLKIPALKMVRPPRDQIEKHYPNTKEWLEGMGRKTLDNYSALGRDPIEDLGTDDPIQIGEMIKEWNINFLMSGPLVACVVEGFHAIKAVRTTCGFTLPIDAAKGTIRGDYSTTSAAVGNAKRAAIKNLVHASANMQEARYEIPHWFKDDELCPYSSAHESYLS